MLIFTSLPEEMNGFFRRSRSMGNRNIKYLIGSLILTAVVCISVFVFMSRDSKKNNEQIIGEIGSIYMEEMSKRIAMHFNTTMDLRLSQLENIKSTVIYDDFESYDDFTERLRVYAQVRTFGSLGLYSRDGEIYQIYGEGFSLYDPETFKQAINRDDKRFAVGVSESGEVLVVFGVHADYPMPDGERSVAIVGVVPANNYASLLSLSGEDSLIYSHMIRSDGSFIFKGSYVNEDNYFDFIRDDFGEVYADQANEYVDELHTAMTNAEAYSKLIYLGGVRRQMYSTPLDSSNWYLLSVMPYGEIDELVNNNNRHWIYTVVACSLIIIIMLVIIFIFYLNMVRGYIKQLEISRQEALNATRAKSEFLSNMSHDIRTPMNAIVGMTAIADANINDKQQVQECLKKITVSSKHLLGLINDILDMSKIESGKMTLNMEQVSLREVMDSIVNIVQPQIKTKKQHFDVFIHDITTEDVYCDSVRLNQVLINIISNAIKFTPDGGAIKVSLYEEESPVGDSHVRVHMLVRDSGIGMSEEFKKNVFEAFMREDRRRVNKTEGTGLGMAITKYIVDAMGGTIEVESEQGSGTEFHVTVDMEKAVVREEEMILPDLKMLLVDDDKQLCETALASLRDIGINADHTLDGESAIDMVKDRHDSNNNYQVILMDWKLPGIDGVEASRRIKEQTGENVPIILISAYDWTEIESEAKAAGISGFISKPLFKSTLYYGLKKYLFADSAQPAEEQAEKSSFGGKRILLAEDNDLNWEIAEALLEDLDLKLERAENGQICVDMFKKSEPGYYSAVLMDIRMPVMTGYEAAEEIRKTDREDSDIPIIAMTADAFSEDIQKCLESGMNAHVAKPIDVQTVARLLAQYIL